MKNTIAIFKRELTGYFSSPVAYVILVIFLLVLQGFTFFIGRFLDVNQANLTTFFEWHPWIYMVFVPAVGMKLWSEEYRLGTVELLMTMPISPWYPILGKFLAAAVVWAIALFLTFPIVLTVYYLGSPDTGPIIGAYLGSYLYALSCLAITSAVSAFTRNQVVCFIVSVPICLLLTILGWQPVTDAFLKIVPSAWENLVYFLRYLSLLNHYNDMAKGLVVAKDVLYFLSLITVCLFTTHVAIQARRS